MDPRRIPPSSHVALTGLPGAGRQDESFADSDEELVARAGKGDAVAFTRLVGRHQTRLRALILRTLGDRALAEDIVQEVFTRAWTHAPTWKTAGSARPSYAAWLSRIAVNLAIDNLRRAKPVALDVVVDPADPAPLPDAGLIEHEGATSVRAAIAALPERQRLALGLTYDVGLPNAEGAAAMNTSIGAFELLLVRARQSLRRTLRES